MNELQKQLLLASKLYRATTQHEELEDDSFNIIFTIVDGSPIDYYLKFKTYNEFKGCKVEKEENFIVKTPVSISLDDLMELLGEKHAFIAFMYDSGIYFNKLKDKLLNSTNPKRAKIKEVINELTEGKQNHTFISTLSETLKMLGDRNPTLIFE